jgi:DNA replication protein DnaC
MSSPKPTLPTTSASLADQLAQIGLIEIAASLEDFLSRAVKGHWSPRQLFEEAARIEIAAKIRRSVQRRLDRSRIGRFKPISDFDWNWPKKIDRDAIERACALDFLKDAQVARNFVLIGSNGLGKSMIAKNIAYQAASAGYSVLFMTAAEIIDTLDTHSPEALRRKIARLAQPQLLVIDEVGYLAYDHHAADLLYKVIDRRYERRSVVVTTNLAFKDWNTVFPNATSIATLLDKLTHHADVTLIQGDSYRVHESQKEAAARRKKP